MLALFGLYGSVTEAIIFPVNGEAKTKDGLFRSAPARGVVVIEVGGGDLFAIYVITERLDFADDVTAGK